MEAINPALTGVRIVRISDALDASDVIILAINAQNYATLRPYAKLLDEKIIVEVSNPEKFSKEKSAAERLQEMFPTARVCKAFNTVSAYALSDSNPVAGGSNLVYVSADDLEVRAHVKRMAVDMGLQALEMGGLQSARKLERAQQTLLLGWGWATVVTGVWFAFWLTYETCRRFVMRDTDPSRFPMNVFNVVMSTMAITNLALCYLPGCIAAFLQIAWGTKYRAFPRWMDLWLKMRKQLGLYGLIFALMHVFISVCLMNPGYYPFFYKKNSTDSHGHNTGHNLMTWRAELCILLGALSTGLYILLGITSLPSVGAMLNWREWRFVQSYLGHACLLLAMIWTL
ncbi:hypothetical protein CAPTEDRAFT_117237 [Capitella teleta]|uniref:Ferric oxidoreductase domain-containing protein n=1 Tax=Capitella teleta TaxID=283909 RepID=R7TEZ2_CAPTE|nr:hypothetical protein CAPTEDRAFT_117237 [Capitella teleta]|eukprot:ELT89636.1 hypothetical protein CAPTEDRAFT_117237 [Capitella teleta]